MRLLVIVLSILYAAAGLYAQTDTPNTTVGAKDVIAEVLGKEINVKDSAQIRGLIFRPLLNRFAEENNIVPMIEELDTFIQKLQEISRKELVQAEQERQKLLDELKSDSLGEKEREQKESSSKSLEKFIISFRESLEQMESGNDTVRQEQLENAKLFVTSWKINHALFLKYGGRVIFQQMGPEPLDAYRDFLKEEGKKGAFRIIDKKYEGSFWRYFVNESMHSFYPEEEGKKIMNTPWWLMDKPLN